VATVLPLDESCPPSSEGGAVFGLGGGTEARRHEGGKRRSDGGGEGSIRPDASRSGMLPSMAKKVPNKRAGKAGGKPPATPTAAATPAPTPTNPAPGKPSSLLDTRVVYCGDNLEQLARLPDRCVDLVYIDPPFNSNRNYEVFWGETKEKRAFEDRHASTQAYIDSMRPRCVKLARVLNDRAVLLGS